MKSKIAIIGSGISAAAICYYLDKNKYHIEIFEKARGLGGRMSYKRIDDAIFDHGANCFGAIHCEEFVRFISPLIKKDLIQRWTGNFFVYDSANNRIQNKEEKERLISCPRSNSLIKEIFNNIDVKQIHLGKKAFKIISKKDKKLQIIFDDQSKSSDFDYVITSAPAPQSAELIPENCSFLKQIKQINYNATYALMLEFKNNDIEKSKLYFSHIAVKHDIITRIAYENSKPSRDLKNHCILIQSSSEYANNNLETDIDKIKEDMMQTFAKITKITKKPESSWIHRWLYSNPKNNLNIDQLFDYDLNIGAIGDYLNRPRIEFAFESGFKMAKLLNSQN